MVRNAGLLAGRKRDGMNIPDAIAKLEDAASKGADLVEQLKKIAADPAAQAAASDVSALIADALAILKDLS